MTAFISAFLVLYVIERGLETFWFRKKIQGQIGAPYTLYWLVGVYFLMVLVLFWEWFGSEDPPVSKLMSSTGITLVLLSLVGRNWAITTLGPYHSIHIEIRPNHQLIQSGPYRFVRNPYYMSNAVEVIGLPLTAGAKLAMIISLLVYLPLLILRMVLEEKALEKKFDLSFVEYKKRVPRILPRLF